METEPDPPDITAKTFHGFLQDFTCRICLYRHKDNSELLGPRCSDIMEKIHTHLSIQVSEHDESRLWICKFCDQSLTSFDTFYNKVNQIQSSLLNLISAVQSKPVHNGEPNKLDEELDVIETTIGFARQKKQRQGKRPRVSEIILEPIRRMSTRKRKTKHTSVTNIKESVPKDIFESSLGTSGIKDVPSEINVEMDTTESSTLMIVKTEHIEESSAANHDSISDAVEKSVTENDDASSMEDQDWVGQGLSFDVDSDDDHTWEPPKARKTQLRSAKKKGGNDQSERDDLQCDENDVEKTLISDEEIQGDTSIAKLRITATHGTEPKPKLPASVRKLLRAEMNAKFMDFYGVICDICLKNNNESTMPVKVKATNYKSFEALCDHMQSEHSTRGYVKCCNCTMREKKRAERHMLLHTQPGSIFKCNICGKQLSSQQSFRCHILLHLPDSERPFQCDVCNRGFVTKADLSQHERQHLPEDKRLCYTCDICGSRFTAEAGLVIHKQRVHENLRPHLCDLCAKSFSSRCDMERHRAQIHGNVKREQCPECGKWFKGSSILKTHMRQHKGQQYKCQFCDKTYSVRSSWKAHQLKHSDEKPHQCPVCDKKFKLPGTLKMHLNQHTGELPYSCPFCPKKFASSGNYYTHRKRMHRDEVAQLKEATQASLVASGLPPPTLPVTTTTQSISEAIARTKEKVAAKAKTESLSNQCQSPADLPPPPGAKVIASVTDVGETIVFTPTSALSSDSGVIETPTVSVPQDDSEMDEVLELDGGIPVAISSVPANATPLQIIPNIRKLPDISQYGPGSLKLIRLVAPDGTAKLVFMKQDQSNVANVLAKNVIGSHQPVQSSNDLSGE